MSSAENEQVGGEGAMEDDDGIEDNIGMNLLQEQFTIETMNSKDTGAEIIDFINSLPPGRTKYHKGLTSNRVLKALKNLLVSMKRDVDFLQYKIKI